VLQWNLGNVTPAVKIHLNTVAVAASGTHVSVPNETRHYSLIASSGPAKRTLATVLVTVDTSACRSAEIERAFLLIRASLRDSIEFGQATYWPKNPHLPEAEQPTQEQLRLRPTADGIEFFMRFRIAVKEEWAGIDWAPDPFVTLSGTFRLAIANGEVVANSVNAHGETEAPEWVWLLAAPLIELALAISDANEDTNAVARAIPSAIARGLNSITQAAANYRLHSISVGERNEKPFMDITECPLLQLTPTVPPRTPRN
jgi:hypothetical protein